MSEKFNLKWNDFQSNASKAFNLFRNETYLHDVTLVSDDLKQIPAHKIVLSACSEYFRSILQETKQAQPLLCLDGVSSDDLKNVLDYVYDGEVRIYQDDLDRFLAVAQKLKLQGLLGDNNQPEEDTKYKELLLYETTEPDVQESVKKELPRSAKRHIPSRTQMNDGVIALNNDSPSTEDLQNKIEENIINNPDGSISCRVCGRSEPKDRPNKKWIMKRHMEVHIEGLTYQCSSCPKTFRSNNSLTNHIYISHKI